MAPVEAACALWPFINFHPVPEAKSGKARIHLDVLVGDLQAGLTRVKELGGSDTGMRETLPRGRIAVMRDPEGNEFWLPCRRGGEAGAYRRPFVSSGGFGAASGQGAGAWP